MSRDFRSSSSAINSKNVIKKTARFAENVTSITKQQHSIAYKYDKENLIVKESEASISTVKELKRYYEEISISRKHAIVDGATNATSTGAIKKRKNSDSRVEPGEEKIIVPMKCPGIREDIGFLKSRFTVYTDESANSEAKEFWEIGRSKETSEKTAPIKTYLRYPVTDKTLNKLTPRKIIDNVQSRYTPVDVPSPPTVKKVKVLHKKRSMLKYDEPVKTSDSVLYNWEYELPYDDYFITCELEKEMLISNISRNVRQRNITTEQRKIILKFLIRVNAHMFLPSFFLYQMVKLFDTFLDAKVVEVKELQLVALTAMWIALKREHIAYSVPSAEKMISFSMNLYEGKTELLLKCEMDILQTLRWNIVFPDPYSILCYDITKCNRSQFMNSNEIELAYCCGSYMVNEIITGLGKLLPGKLSPQLKLDLSLFDEDLMKMSAVLLAATAAETALYFTMEKVNDTSEPQWFNWRTPDTAKRYSDQEIEVVRSALIRKISKSLRRHSDGDIVFKKYNRSRYGRISHFLGNKVKSYLHEE